MSPLVDPFGRAITYIRVSVTDRCDFRCVYCMSEDMTFLPKQDLLSLEELDRLCSAFVRLGTRKIRITGGEPLVRRGVMTLFRSLSRHIGAGSLDELTVTTNGSQLARYAAELRDCGVERINVSLDSLNPDRFRALTRWGDFAQVMKGIDAAQAAGLKVKINAVALKGVNDEEAPEMIAWARLRPHLHRSDAAWRCRRGAFRPISAADGAARPVVAPLHAEPVDARQRRPRALFRRRRDRRPARLHHAADA
jgi:cyclic pyranopterin phosphate synthase